MSEFTFLEEKSDKQKEYQRFFKKTVKKETGKGKINDLSDGEKKKVFNKIDNSWNSEKEAGKDGKTSAVKNESQELTFLDPTEA